MEHIPNPVHLWKETVNLETNPADAHIILSCAVEVIPLSVELWLALARLETPERVKAVVNEARKAIPTSHDIWIAAGRFLEQEACSNPDAALGEMEKQLAMVDKIDNRYRDVTNAFPILNNAMQPLAVLRLGPPRLPPLASVPSNPDFSHRP